MPFTEKAQPESQAPTTEAARGGVSYPARDTSPVVAIESLAPAPIQRMESPPTSFSSSPSPSVASSGVGANRTGLPGGFKAKLEKSFGTSLDQVRVTKNSSFPAKVGAIATTRGSQIDVAPGHYQPQTAQGQKLLGHEAWHTVQQASGRVKPTLQMKTGYLVNDSRALEQEADRAGEAVARGQQFAQVGESATLGRGGVIQRVLQKHFVTMDRYDPDKIMHWYHDDSHPGTYKSTDDQGHQYTYHYDETEPGYFTGNDGNEINNWEVHNGPQQNNRHDPKPPQEWNGLTYELDNYHRVIKVKGVIGLGGAETGRSQQAQYGAWEQLIVLHSLLFDARKIFHGGHIIAHKFGGSPGTHNLVPMEGRYNQGDKEENKKNSYYGFGGTYAKMEGELHSLIEYHGDLNIEIIVSYPEDSLRRVLGEIVNNPNAQLLEDLERDDPEGFNYSIVPKNTY